MLRPAAPSFGSPRPNIAQMLCRRRALTERSQQRGLIPQLFDRASATSLDAPASGLARRLGHAPASVSRACTNLNRRAILCLRSLQVPARKISASANDTLFFPAFLASMRPRTAVFLQQVSVDPVQHIVAGPTFQICAVNPSGVTDKCGAA